TRVRGRTAPPAVPPLLIRARMGPNSLIARSRYGSGTAYWTGSPRARRRSACSLRANFHRPHTEPASSHGVGSLAAPGGVLFARIAFVAVDCMSRPSSGPDGAVSQLT